MAEFFTEVAEPVRYAGPDSDDPLTYRWYGADRAVGERTKEPVKHRCDHDSQTVHAFPRR